MKEVCTGLDNSLLGIVMQFWTRKEGCTLLLGLQESLCQRRSLCACQPSKSLVHVHMLPPLLQCQNCLKRPHLGFIVESPTEHQEEASAPPPKGSVIKSDDGGTEGGVDPLLLPALDAGEDFFLDAVSQEAIKTPNDEAPLPALTNIWQCLMLNKSISVNEKGKSYAEGHEVRSAGQYKH